MWMTAGHSDLWNCQGTYCGVPYDYLPQLNRATDDLAWLEDISPELRKVIKGSSTLNSSNNEIANLETVVAKAKHLGLSLPAPLVRFFRSAELQDKVPTCTDCYLSLSDTLVPVPFAPGTYLLRFLNDSQSCVMWYLCFDGGVEAGVVASDYFLEPDIFDAMEYEGVRREDIFQNVFTCAETFTEFLYRFWIENTIWYSLYKRLPLTLVQEEYRGQITRKL